METGVVDPEGVVRPPTEAWASWRVYWGAVWVGTLASLALALLLGLAGIALGAYSLSARAVTTWKEFGVGALVFSIVGTWVAVVVGGWVAGKIAGFRRAEPAMLHGAIVWLLAVPLFVLAAALGAGHYFGNWYGGLAGTPAWVTPAAAATDPAAAAAARNGALGSLTALLLGLVAAVLGGWWASGEPMSWTYHRHRDGEERPAAIRRPLDRRAATR